MSGASRGFLYVATGARHIRETVQSAKTLAVHMPDVPRILFADSKADIPEGLFSEVRLLSKVQRSFLDKIAPLSESPFQNTVFLDTDTHLCGPVDDLFELLEQYDLAAAHAAMRHDGPFSTPNAFAELNTGVIAYRLTPEVREMFARWQSLYEAEIAASGQMGSDQPSFRQAVWESRIPLYVFAPEYNFRTTMPAATGRVRVRIIHGRDADMNRLEERVNGSRNIRVFLPGWREWEDSHFRILAGPGFYFSKLTSLLVRGIKSVERKLEPIKRALIPR